MQSVVKLQKINAEQARFQNGYCLINPATSPSLLGGPAAVSYHRVSQAAADGDGEWRDATLAVLPKAYAAWSCAQGGWDLRLN